MERRKESLESVWLAARTTLYPKLTYSAKFVPWTDTELEDLDKEVARIIRKWTRKSRTIPRAIIWADRGRIGMGLLPLSTLIRIEQAKIALRYLANPEQDNGGTMSRFDGQWGRNLQRWLHSRGIEISERDTSAEVTDSRGACKDLIGAIVHKQEWGGWRKLQQQRGNVWTYICLRPHGRKLEETPGSGTMQVEELEGAVEFNLVSHKNMGRELRVSQVDVPIWVEKIQDNMWQILTGTTQRLTRTGQYEETQRAQLGRHREQNSSCRGCMGRWEWRALHSVYQV